MDFTINTHVIFTAPQPDGDIDSQPRRSTRLVDLAHIAPSKVSWPTALQLGSKSKVVKTAVKSGNSKATATTKDTRKRKGADSDEDDHAPERKRTKRHINVLNLASSEDPTWAGFPLPCSSLLGKVGKDVPDDLLTFKLGGSNEENPFRIGDESLEKPHPDVIPLPVKDRIYLRCLTWVQRHPDDPFESLPWEHPTLRRVTKLISFKCKAGTRDWYLLLRACRQSFLYQDLLKKQDPLYDTYSADDKRPFQPLGAVRYVAEGDAISADEIRNLFAHQSIVLAPPNPDDLIGTSMLEEHIEEGFGIDIKTPTTMHRE